MKHHPSITLAMLVGALAILTLPVHPIVASQRENGTGLSSERVSRIEQLIQRHVDERALPGAVLLLAHRGKVATLRAFGLADVESLRPMRTDSLFRLASAAKIVTTVGLLTLYEDGRFALTDPVGRYLPELRALKIQAPGGHTTPATRPLTIRDLLRHTSGYGYGSDARQRVAYQEAGIMRPGPEEDWSHDLTLAEWVGRLATVPLVNEPATRFDTASVGYRRRTDRAAGRQTARRFPAGTGIRSVGHAGYRLRRECRATASLDECVSSRADALRARRGR